MATVTGYTSARMKEIEDSSVVDGAIVADELILTRFDGSTINAGNVKGDTGATGATGAQGDVSAAQLTAAIDALKATVYASVNHGANAAESRPTGYAGVIWFGSVQPVNATGVDLVVRTDEAL